MNQQKTKVFGIGLNKTGTTTLGECGEILGFDATSCDRVILKDVVYTQSLNKAFEKVHEYDFFEDWPWPLIYKELDLQFPNSKFILTVRKNEEVWLESLKRHSLTTKPFRHCRKMVYGFNYPHGHEEHFIKFYNDHNNAVREYFAGRDEDFLEICWEEGSGFEELCTFLNLELVSNPTPHRNSGDSRKPSPLIKMANNALRFF